MRSTLTLALLATLATLAACGGNALDGDDVAVAVVAPLLDDEGRLMPSDPLAMPADAAARSPAQHYATAAQARQLEAALGAGVVRIDLDSGASAAASLALRLSPSARAMAGLPDGVPVLVHGRDLRLAAALAEQLATAGLTRVWVVTT